MTLPSSQKPLPPHFAKELHSFVDEFIQQYSHARQFAGHWAFNGEQHRPCVCLMEFVSGKDTASNEITCINMGVQPLRLLRRRMQSFEWADMAEGLL